MGRAFESLQAHHLTFSNIKPSRALNLEGFFAIFNRKAIGMQLIYIIPINSNIMDILATLLSRIRKIRSFGEIFQILKNLFLFVNCDDALGRFFL